MFIATILTSIPHSSESYFSTWVWLLNKIGNRKTFLHKLNSFTILLSISPSHCWGPWDCLLSYMCIYLQGVSNVCTFFNLWNRKFWRLVLLSEVFSLWMPLAVSFWYPLLKNELFKVFFFKCMASFLSLSCSCPLLLAIMVIFCFSTIMQVLYWITIYVSQNLCKFKHFVSNLWISNWDLKRLSESAKVKSYTKVRQYGVFVWIAQIWIVFYIYILFSFSPFCSV